MSPSKSIIAHITNTKYNYKQLDRSDGIGGGVVILYKTNFKLSNYKTYLVPHCECLITTFKLPSNKHIRIVTIYRPPSSQYICFLDYFHQLVSSIPIENTIIVGDFNFHINKPDKPTNSFINSLDNLSLIQHITKPTHMSGNTLDLVITSSTSIFDISILPITDIISDHYALSFSISNTYRSSSLKTIYYREIKNIPLNLIKSDLICFPNIKYLISLYSTITYHIY